MNNTRHRDVEPPLTPGSRMRITQLYRDGVDLESAKRIVQKENDICQAKALIGEISNAELSEDVRSLLQRIVILACPGAIAK